MKKVFVYTFNINGKLVLFHINKMGDSYLILSADLLL